jgi:hypothetical protein
MDDDVRGQELQQEQKGGTAETDRRTLLRTAGLQTKHGIHNHENLIFDELIADKKYQFVYCFTPAPIKGATGSNGCPIAIT